MGGVGGGGIEVHCDSEMLYLCSSRKTYLGRIRSKTLCEVRKVRTYVCPSMGRARRTLVHTTCPTSPQVDNRLGVPVGTKLWKVTADESALSSKE